MNAFIRVAQIMFRPGGASVKTLPILAFVLLSLTTCVLSVDDEYAYDYGNTDVNYDSIVFDDERSEEPLSMPVKSSTLRTADKNRRKSIPLCCEKGQVYDYHSCTSSKGSTAWIPRLDGASELITFEKGGLPVCQVGIDRIDLYQKDVLFTEHSEAILPNYILLDAVPPESYCVTNIVSEDGNSNDGFQTKVFACRAKKEDTGLMWTCVVIAHTLLLLTLLTYFIMGELRCLQGQYMICMVISLLMYNIFLFPLSKISLNISDMGCIALGAIKYFYFCGIFLWFNVMCFDVWRTLSCRQDVSGRRRFVAYSLYCWLLGAVLTTIILVLPYTQDGNNPGTLNDPVRESGYKTCKLKMEMDMILQLAQLISILFDIVFLVLATCNMCGYDQLGNGLLRSDASLCLKQCWKLFVVMIAHMLSSIDKDMIKFPITMWQYILLESVAVFGVFAYRKTVIRWFMLKTCAGSSNRERGTPQEKNHLTIA